MTFLGARSRNNTNLQRQQADGRHFEEEACCDPGGTDERCRAKRVVGYGQLSCRFTWS